jgi:hypothetical protein
MDRLMKIRKVVTLISMILTFMAAAVSIAGVGITGFYPGIIVFLLLTLIPITSIIYTKKIVIRSNTIQRNYFMIMIVTNLLTILVVLWMTFVILVDRVFGAIL